MKEEANETLSYNDKSTLLFSEALSKNRRESDIVTIIHLPIVVRRHSLDFSARCIHSVCFLGNGPPC